MDKMIEAVFHEMFMVGGHTKMMYNRKFQFLWFVEFRDIRGDNSW